MCGERIVGVNTIGEHGAAELDATGLAFAPGFVGVHAHDDFAILADPELDFEECSKTFWPSLSSRSPCWRC